MQLPVKDPSRNKTVYLLTKLQSVFRGFRARKIYGQRRFLWIVTGRRVEAFTKAEIAGIPTSIVPQVLLKEKHFGQLKASKEVREKVAKNRSFLAFKNGHKLTEGQIYSGQWNETASTK